MWISRFIIKKFILSMFEILRNQSVLWNGVGSVEQNIQPFSEHSIVDTLNVLFIMCKLYVITYIPNNLYINASNKVNIANTGIKCLVFLMPL
jgi:hypothetical protein